MRKLKGSYIGIVDLNGSEYHWAADQCEDDRFSYAVCLDPGSGTHEHIGFYTVLDTEFDEDAVEEMVIDELRRMSE